MTTASIYYHPASNQPAFVLIDGNSEHIHQADYDAPPAADPGVGARIRAIDHACRRLGWKVVDNAPIVRQADGRGTIRIEPSPELLAATRAVDASNKRIAAELSGPETVAYVDTNEAGTPQKVLVDGRTEPVHTPCSLSSSNPANADRAVTAVHVALAALGYHPTGPIVRRAEGSATDHMRTMPVAADDDWRDVPTLVRIDDDAANDLNELATTLGIPGDVLASAWITAAARDARSRHARFADPNDYPIVDQSRIKGWMADGTPHLDTASETISYAHRRFIGPKG
jgi:hypothetical protein